jgi:hypothetical protein
MEMMVVGVVVVIEKEIDSCRTEGGVGRGRCIFRWR